MKTGRVELCVVGDGGTAVVSVKGFVENRRSEDMVDVSGTTSGLDAALLMVVLPVTGTPTDQEVLSVKGVDVDTVEAVVSVAVETMGILDAGDSGTATFFVVVCCSCSIVVVKTNDEVILGAA